MPFSGIGIFLTPAKRDQSGNRIAAVTSAQKASWPTEHLWGVGTLSQAVIHNHAGVPSAGTPTSLTVPWWSARSGLRMLGLTRASFLMGGWRDERFG